jgi:hypothetical protein
MISPSVRTTVLLAAAAFLASACGVGQEQPPEQTKQVPSDEGRSSYALGTEQLEVSAALPLANDSSLLYRYRNGEIDRSWTATQDGEGLEEFFSVLSPGLKAQLKTQLPAELASARTQAHSEFLQTQQGILESAESGKVLSCSDHYSTRQCGCVAPGYARMCVYYCHGWFWQSCSCSLQYTYTQFSGTCG